MDGIKFQEYGWEAPLYWEHNESHGINIDNRWTKKDFRGVHEIEPNEPVVNVSYYEADAYATWAGKRLPTEAESERSSMLEREYAEEDSVSLG